MGKRRIENRRGKWARREVGRTGVENEQEKK